MKYIRERSYMGHNYYRGTRGMARGRVLSDSQTNQSSNSISSSDSLSSTSNSISSTSNSYSYSNSSANNKSYSYSNDQFSSASYSYSNNLSCQEPDCNEDNKPGCNEYEKLEHCMEIGAIIAYAVVIILMLIFNEDN